MRWWERSLGLDVRSLALLRIGLGLFTAADAVQRALEAPIFYSEAGVLPRAALSASINKWLWSLNMVSDTIWWQFLLLGILIMAGLVMAAGYRTGIAAFIAWVLTVSVQNRNEVILDGGDMVHRLLLFWSLLVPLGAVWSIDSLRRPWTGPRTVTSAGTAGFRLQMIMIFVFAAVLKTGDPWRKDFTAVWYALNWDVYTTRFGIWLRQFPGLLSWITKGTMVVEGIVPLGLLVPVAPVQLLAILALLSLHVGFILCMHLLMFSSVMMLGWMTLTPQSVWDRLGVPLELPERWRGRLAERSSALPSAARPPWFERWPRASHSFAILSLLYVVAWNVRTTNHDRFARFFPTRLNAIGYSLRIDQYWIMFAPSPTREDGWLVVPARLAGGGEVDLFRGGAPVSWERPESVSATYRNRRWRRYYWSVTRADSVPTREQYARYLCKAWRDRSDEVIKTFDIVLMREIAQPDLTNSAPDKLLLWHHECN